MSVSIVPNTSIDNQLTILKTAENYTYLTFAHPVLKPLPASGRGLERGSVLSEVLNCSQYTLYPQCLRVHQSEMLALLRIQLEVFTKLGFF